VFCPPTVFDSDGDSAMVAYVTYQQNLKISIEELLYINEEESDKKKKSDSIV